MTSEQEKLVKDNIGLVYHVAKLLGVAQDEDLIQDGMVELCRAAISFCENKGAKYSTFAYRCVRNKMLSVIKKRSIESQTGADDVAEICNEAIQPEDCIDLWEIQAAIEKLNKRTKKIVKLLMEGYTQTEIASLLGISRPVVSNTLKKLKNKQRKSKDYWRVER